MIEIVMKVDDEFWNIINQLKEFKGQKEIVHCKDCKYYGKRFTSIIRGMHCLRYGEQMGAEDFCSRGEKR